MVDASGFQLLFAARAIVLRGADANVGSALRIDIPAKLEKVRVVFNVDHLAEKGDMPIALGHMLLLTNDLRNSSGKGQIIALFHTDAGDVTLNEQAYNTGTACDDRKSL